MSKEKKETQMSLWEDSLANQCQSQEKEKEQMMTAISGQKCLDSLGRSNPNSLLGRMCKELLTSKTAWYSDRCKTSWKVKVSKSNVSLFQLQASVLGTKGTESGLWPLQHNGLLAAEKGEGRIMEEEKERNHHLREQVDPETMKIYQDMGQVEKHSIKETIVDTNNIYPNEINKLMKPHRRRTEATSQSSGEDVPTPTQDQRRENEEEQGGTIDGSSSRGGKKMYPTPEHDNEREPRNSEEESREEEN